MVGIFLVVYIFIYRLAISTLKLMGTRHESLLLRHATCPQPRYSQLRKGKLIDKSQGQASMLKHMVKGEILDQVIRGVDLLA